MKPRRVLLIPLDPVHDVGLKMIHRHLMEHEHQSLLLAPDLPVDEIVRSARSYAPEVVLVSRTIGYGAGELLSRLIDALDQAGVRDHARVAVGGMAVRRELAAELGFDAGFGPGTTVEEAVAYVEGRQADNAGANPLRERIDLTSGHSYEWKHTRIRDLAAEIGQEALDWAMRRTSPGVRRAHLRTAMLDGGGEASQEARTEYLKLADPMILAGYLRGEPAPRTRFMTREEIGRGAADAKDAGSGAEAGPAEALPARWKKPRPAVFIQYGTGCPLLDSAHIKVAEAWGADGVVHFDPSWGARREGFLEGHVTHEEDGTVITPENLRLISASRAPHTLWQVRAHRGLNTPETVVLAASAGADLTKINIAYGSLGAGTDPERLTVDGVECLVLAAQHGLPYDVVTNEELCGVPSYKAFAAMLTVAWMGLYLGGRPVLQPLFCNSPEVMVGQQMDDNYVDFNVAKVIALRRIMDAPLWPGAPVGFLTHTGDRVQSATTTALHAALASSLGVDGVSIASSDEAYSGGPISAMARVDTLRATRESLRFFGNAGIAPTPQALEWAEILVERIEQTLEAAALRGSFVSSLYEGVFGSRQDGAYPGRAGRGTVTMR